MTKNPLMGSQNKPWDLNKKISFTIKSMNSFYKGKTILVTWSTGFKGAWLSLWLHSLWAKVIGYALKPDTEPNLFSILKLEQKITQIYADINNLQKLEEVCNIYKPEIVFHLAAQALVRESYNNPVGTFQTNVMGTVHILECIRKTKSILWAILITTDKVYENKEIDYAYKEEDRLGWYDPYSTSKAMDELAITSYVRSFFPNTEKKIVSVRAGNVIGGGDWSQDRLIPDIIKAFEKNESVIIRNPDSIRPWQHVLEALYGYLIMGERIFLDNSYLWAYNFWPNKSDAMKVEDIVKQAIGILWKWNYEIKKDSSLHEAWFLMLDNTKAKEKLGWNPRYTTTQALEKTLKWYNAYYKWEENMEVISLEEIKNILTTIL